MKLKSKLFYIMILFICLKQNICGSFNDILHWRLLEDRTVKKQWGKEHILIAKNVFLKYPEIE